MIEQLVSLADIWCEARERSHARLSTIVANNGKLFAAIERGAGVQVDTFEKFLQFFRDPANWPDGLIPTRALALLDNFKNIATVDVASSDKEEEIIALARRVAPRAAETGAGACTAPAPVDALHRQGEAA